MPANRFPRLWSLFPAFNFIIASGALSFQVFVLYPWHREIDKSHHELTHRVEKRFGEIGEDIKKLTNDNQLLKQEMQQLVLSECVSNGKHLIKEIQHARNAPH